MPRAVADPVSSSRAKRAAEQAAASASTDPNAADPDAPWAGLQQQIASLAVPPPDAEARRRAELEVELLDRILTAEDAALQEDAIRQQEVAEKDTERTINDLLESSSPIPAPVLSPLQPVQDDGGRAGPGPSAAAPMEEEAPSPARRGPRPPPPQLVGAVVNADQQRFRQTQRLGEPSAAPRQRVQFAQALAIQAAANAKAHAERQQTAVAQREEVREALDQRPAEQQARPHAARLLQAGTVPFSNDDPLLESPELAPEPEPVRQSRAEQLLAQEQELLPHEAGMLPSDLVVGDSAVLPDDDTFNNLGDGSTNIDEAGSSFEAKEVWRRWIETVNRVRKDSVIQFLADRSLQEDLTLGPRDHPRLYHTGFRRRGPNEAGVDPHEIRWYGYRRKDPTARPGRGGGGVAKIEYDSAAQLLDDLQAKKTASFYPERIKKEFRGRIAFKQAPQRSKKNNRQFFGGAFRSQRNFLGLIEEEEAGTGLAAMVRVDRDIQSNRKWAKKDDGSLVLIDGKPKTVARERAVRHATRNIRIVWIPIRLNELHWESCYWRELKNEKMFEPAHMTPYLHNKEFTSGTAGTNQMEFSNSAVPLLTPGSMNFYGVELAKMTHPADASTLALATPAACTLEAVCKLPRVDFDNTNCKPFSTHMQTQPATPIGPDSVGAYYLGVDSFGTSVPTWRTIFRIRRPQPEIDAEKQQFAKARKDPNKVREFDYFQNYYRVPANATLEKFGVLGYGDAPTEDAARERRLGPARFRGKPIYHFSGEQSGNQFGQGTSARDRDGQKYLLDIRICSYEYKGPDAGQATSVNSARNKWYSELYRRAMWRPLPLRSWRTLPDASESFRDAVDPGSQNGETQLPAYLNMHHDRTYPVPPPKGGVRRPEEDFGRDYSSIPANRGDEEADPRWFETVDPSVRGVAPRPGAAWLHDSLGQRYPETTLCQRGDMDARAAVMHKFFVGASDVAKVQRRDDTRFQWFFPTDGLAETMESGAVKWRSSRPLSPQERATRLKRWTEEFDKTVHTRMLAPTTLRDALRRYVSENRKAMQYFSTTTNRHGVATPLLTDPMATDAPAGIYFSCRFDTGGGSSRGGLDTFFPCSKDADVYTIADVMLARGVHDYLRESNPEDDSQGIDKRAGPPNWWKEEMEEYTPEPLFDDVEQKKMEGAEPWPPKNTEVAKLRFPNGATKSVPKKGFSFGTVAFDDFTPPNVNAEAATAALPFATDQFMDRQPIYFQRLSDLSQNAVWKRWLALERRWGRDGGTEISDPDRLNDSERLVLGERGYLAPRDNNKEPGADLAVPPSGKQPKRGEPKETNTQIDAERTTDSLETLVAPCYVVALDYDDFMQAVETIERQWSAYFEGGEGVAGHLTFWKEFDMYKLIDVETSRGTRKVMVPNPNYKLPTEVTPPRLAGRWATYDGPPELEDFLSGQTYVPTDMQYSVRPAERFRSSWMWHKKQFGDRLRPDGSDPREDFKRTVAEWEAAHAQYTADLRLWDDLNAADRELKVRNEMLRFHSLRLVLNLGQWLEVDDVTKLFKDDANLAFDTSQSQGGSGLQRQVLAAKSPTLLNSDDPELWFTRLPIAIFLMDTVDHAEQVRLQLEWYTRVHAQLQGKSGTGAAKDLLDRVERATAAQNNPPRYVKDLLKVEFDWPNSAEVDSMMRFAAMNVTKLLTKLASVGDTWTTIVRVATRLLTDPNGMQPDPGLVARSDPLSLDSRHWRILAGMDPLSYQDRYGIAEGFLEELYEWLQSTEEGLRRLGSVPANQIENHPVQIVVAALLTDALDNQYHALQTRVRPVILAICDAWIDLLVQTRMREVAFLLNDHFRTENLTVEEYHRQINANVDVDPEQRQRGVAADPNYEHWANPRALRPEAMRSYRSVGGGLRGLASDLEAYARLMGFAFRRPGQRHRTQYELQVRSQTLLVYNERVENVRAQESNTRDKDLFSFDSAALPYDTDQELIESTANAIMRMFPLLKKAGSPAEALWKLLNNRVIQTEDEAALNEAIEGISARLATGTNVADLPQTVVVGAGLLREFLQRQRLKDLMSDAEHLRMNRQRAIHQRQTRRIRKFYRLATVLRRTQVLASRKINEVAQRLRALAAAGGVTADDPVIVALRELGTRFVSVRNKMQSLVEKMGALITWVKMAKNEGKLEKLEGLIRARIKAKKAEADAAKRQRVAADDTSSDDAMGALPEDAEGNLPALTPQAAQLQLDVDAAAEYGQRQLTPEELIDQLVDGAMASSAAAAASTVVDAASSAIEDDAADILDVLDDDDDTEEDRRIRALFARSGTQASMNTDRQCPGFNSEFLKGTFFEKGDPSKNGKEVDRLKEVLRICTPLVEAEGWDKVVELAKQAWIDARTKELQLARTMQQAIQRRRALVDLYAHLLRAEPNLGELNAALKEAQSDNVPRLTDAVFRDLLSGRTAPKQSAHLEIPEQIDKWAIYGWEGGYRQYLAKTLRVRTDGAYTKERWYLTRTPMTPRQWLESPLANGAYPVAPPSFPTTDEDVDVEEEPTDAEFFDDAFAFDELPSANISPIDPIDRVRRALKDMNQTGNEALEDQLLLVLEAQKHAIKTRPLLAPFAFDFYGAAEVRTLPA